MSWSRSAFWLGRPRCADEDALKAIIQHQLVPAMRAFAEVTDARFLWSRECEDGVPCIYFQSILQFADHDALQRLALSPQRLALRPQVLAALDMFDGVVTHINYEDA